MEARLGGRKLVNIPLGFQKRFLRVTIPPGVHPGMIIRLEGMGRQTANGEIFI
jgi:DnaJ-class molecular chaperone